MVSFTFGSGMSYIQAWYMDGQREVLEVGRLLRLAANTGWRKQLAAIQGCVTPQRLEYGVYCVNEDVSTTRNCTARPVMEQEHESIEL